MRYPKTHTVAVVIMLLVALVNAGRMPARAQAAFVVNQCQEASGAGATLKAALDQGQPLITFDCPAGAFINVRETLTIAVNTRLDGTNHGATVTLVNAIPGGEGPGASILPALAVPLGLELDVLNVRFAAAIPGTHAGIRSDGALRVVNSGFAYLADGIEGDRGTLSVRNARFTDNIRGVSIVAALQQASVTSSLFMRNNIGVAGAQGIRPPVNGGYVVSTSIFTNNLAAVQVCSGDDCNQLLDVTVANSIIALNRENFPAVVGRGIRLVNSTLVNNPSGGVVSEDGSITLTNTIVAYNGERNCTGAIVDGGSNLQYPGVTCGAGIRVGLPLLSPLMEPQFGSAALGAGDPGVCASPVVNNIDYYGQARPRGPACSIGAVEGKLEQPPILAEPRHD